MQRRVLGGAAAGVLILLTVGACSAGNGSGEHTSGGDALSNRSAVSGSRPQTAALPAGASTGAGTAASGQDAADQLITDARIRTAQLTVAVHGAAAVSPTAARAAAIAVAAGGEVDADDRTSGAQATAVLQLRVPPTRLEATLDQLSGLGAERSRQLSTTDVSERVADVDSRVLSARESIARLRTLYTHATKVADVIAIESELSSREADLESLEAQQRTLGRQTAMAAIAVTLQVAAKAAAAPPKHRGGFVGGLERGWDGFAAAAAWGATALGTVLPFLALLLVLGLAVRMLWGRLPHRPASAAEPAE